MPLTEEEEFELLSLERDRAMQSGVAPAPSREQLQHQHNINREAEVAAQPSELNGIWIPGVATIPGKFGVRPKEVAEVPRLLGMFGGPPGAAIGEAVGQGLEMVGGVREKGNLPAVAAQAAIPEAVRLVGKAARPIAKGFYSSALKMSTKLKPEKRERILETALDEGRIPTTRSINKSVNRQREIEAEIDAKIATNPNAPIDTQAVASRVDEVAPRFEGMLPEADRAILKGAKEEFARVHPTMTATKAQAAKKASYKLLGEKAYGEQKTAAKEAEKALTRGVKEELEGYFPELKALNAKDGALFDLNRALAQAANRIGNRDVMGIGIPIKTEAFGAAGFLAGLMDAPGVKARLAIAIDKARHLQNANRKLTTGVTRTATMPSVWETE